MGFRFNEFCLIMFNIFPKTASKHIFVEELFNYGLNDEDEDFINPLSEIAESTRRDIFNGKTKIAKKNAKVIYNNFEDKIGFESIIDDLGTPTLEKLAEELTKQGFNCIPFNSAEKCFSLCKAFLNAFIEGTDKISNEKSRTDDENILLEENNRCCPICNNKLLIKTESYYLEYFDTYYIFPHEEAFLNFSNKEMIIRPTDIDAIDNKLLLCKKHSNHFKSMSSSLRYEELIELKNMIRNKYENIDRSEAEESIVNILTVIGKTNPEKIKKELKLKPISLKKKIDPKSEGMLYSEANNYACQYYLFIKEHLSYLDSGAKNVWDKFAKLIRGTYEKISKTNMSKDDIVRSIQKKILSISRVKLTSKNEQASRIITCFFIQNCEVFDEITK